jgi:hypothetical protein
VRASRKVEEVHKHWVVMAWPAVRVAAGVFILVSAFAFEGPVYWVLFLLGMALGVQALWRIIEEYRDRFVITNQRVFRVNGGAVYGAGERAATENLGHHRASSLSPAAG